MTPLESEVWSREQQYWDLMTEARVEEYMALWHDDFAGWPPWSSEPVRKSDIRREVTRGLANIRPGSYRAQLEALSIRVQGDFAFVFYRASATGLDRAGRQFEERYRIHHTWWRTNSGWKIIEGMGANESVSNAPSHT